ncbi:hypothetical protein QPX96_03995 [Limosilactobacillus fermentum]|nr:hypothetical protein [Limosilactobacillus fermentum]
MFPELEASRNQPLSFKKFDEIVAKTGDQIGARFVLTAPNGSVLTNFTNKPTKAWKH